MRVTPFIAHRLPRFLQPWSDRERSRQALTFIEQLQLDPSGRLVRALLRFDDVDLGRFATLMTESVATLGLVKSGSSGGFFPRSRMSAAWRASVSVVPQAVEQEEDGGLVPPRPLSKPPSKDASTSTSDEGDSTFKSHDRDAGGPVGLSSEVLAAPEVIKAGVLPASVQGVGQPEDEMPDVAAEPQGHGPPVRG